MSNLKPPIEYNQGGTGLVAVPADGQLLIGNGAGYTLATLTAGANITITNAAGGITIAASSGSGNITFACEGPSSATSSAGTINFTGVTAQGSQVTGTGSTVTCTNLDWTTSQKGVGVLSTNAQSIAGSATTVAVTPASLTAKLGTQTAHGVALGEGTTSALAYSAAGTSGQVFTSGGALADGAYQNIGTNSGLTNHGVLLGQNNSAFVATAAGTSGQVFTSGGAAADGAYQSLGVNSGLTNHGVLLGQGNSAFVATAVGTTNTVLLGNTGADPSFGAVPNAALANSTITLTQPAAGVTISGSPVALGGTATFALANDLAAVEGLSTTGIAVRTATDTWTTRSLTQPAAGITISNGDGVAGNPTFALANDLAAVEGLSGTGMTARTATDTWTTRTITAGTGISVSNGDGVAGNPTISATGLGAFAWTEVTGTTQTAAVNNGYILNNAGLVTLTLPSTSAVGDIVRVVGKGAGGWRVAQPSAGSVIHFGSSNTTTGATGRLDSTNRYDCVDFICTVANADWTVNNAIGNITVT